MSGDRWHDPYCRQCIFYAPYTRSCDFYLITGIRRGCPGGAGCTRRVTRGNKKQKGRGISVGKPKWDTEEGRRMWEQGMSDVQIAKHFRIAANTVLHQRRSYWEKGLDSPGKKNKEETNMKRPVEDEIMEVVQETSSPARTTDVYELLEAATAHLTGIWAICTAEAILQLWNWDSEEDLLKARGAIDYLLKKLEEN